MTLEGTVSALVQVLAGLDGIERAYDDPPEALTEFPCALAFAGSGSQEVVSDGLGKSLHTVIVEIHHSRQIVQEAIDAAKVWPDRLLQGLYRAQRRGDLQIVWPVQYEALPLPYNQETHYGMRFRVTLKVMAALLWP